MNQEAARELNPAEIRKYSRRSLWSSEQMATKVYHCDLCGREPIFPGDVYRRIVMVQNKRMFVRREHVMPECSPYDPEEERRFLEEADRIHEEYEAREREEAKEATKEAA